MPKLLLALLVTVVVAPAYASQAKPSAPHRWPCPFEQAELAAAGYEPVDSSSVTGPVEGSFFDPGQRSGLLP